MANEFSEVPLRNVEPNYADVKKESPTLSEQMYGTGTFCPIRDGDVLAHASKASKQERTDFPLLEACECLPFYDIDQNRDGKITKDELRNYIKDMKVKQKEEGLSETEKEGIKSAEAVLKNFHKIANLKGIKSDVITSADLNTEIRNLIIELFPGFPPRKMHLMQTREIPKTINRAMGP